MIGKCGTKSSAEESRPLVCRYQVRKGEEMREAGYSTVRLVPLDADWSEDITARAVYVYQRIG